MENEWRSGGNAVRGDAVPRIRGSALLSPSPPNPAQAGAWGEDAHSTLSPGGTWL